MARVHILLKQLVIKKRLCKKVHAKVHIQIILLKFAHTVILIIKDTHIENSDTHNNVRITLSNICKKQK